jgi:hypothetical protein
MARYIESARANFCEELVTNKEYDRAIEITNRPMYSPTIKIREAHPDAEPNTKEHNDILKEVMHDVAAINIELGVTAYAMKSFMEDINGRLKTVKKNIVIEKERLQDINMLCNDFSEFGTVVKITTVDFAGDYSEENGTISAKVSEKQDELLEVYSIEGNGYEGNKCVYKDKAFLIDTIDTSKRTFLVDGSNITQYEYSRIIASNSEKEVFPQVNFDNTEAKCTIVLTSKIAFNGLKINCALEDTKLISLSISSNGTQFQDIVTRVIDLNDANKKYDSTNYIPGSGIVTFPSTNYVKIILQSDGYTEDLIAFEKEIGNIITLSTAKRHVIKLNDITAVRNKYQANNIIKTKQLLSGSTNSIAIFCNEYIPDHFPVGTYLEYILTVNGMDYHMVPINSNRNGKKIIRKTDYVTSLDSVAYINEDIKSVYLTIVITAPNDAETPYISNLKLLIGGE